jgi:hypothetical protein
MLVFLRMPRKSSNTAKQVLKCENHRETLEVAVLYQQDCSGYASKRRSNYSCHMEEYGGEYWEICTKRGKHNVYALEQLVASVV